MWPVLFIVTGLILLLNWFGVMSVTFWQLWRLWPLLIILIGLDLLLGRSSLIGSLVVLAVTVAVVAGVVGLLVTAPNALGTAVSRSSEGIVEPLGDAERAELALDLPAGTLRLRALEDTTSLVDGSLELASGRDPRWEVDRSASIVRMRLDGGQGSMSWIWGGDEWDIGVSPQVGLSLTADVGAGKSEIDLTGLDVRHFEAHIGAGDTRTTFPEVGDLNARITGGVGRIELQIPDTLAVRLEIDRGLSSLDIAGRFKRDGDVYMTDDWGTNPNRIDVTLELGLGLLSVH